MQEKFDVLYQGLFPTNQELGSLLRDSGFSREEKFNILKEEIKKIPKEKRNAHVDKILSNLTFLKKQEFLGKYGGKFSPSPHTVKAGLFEFRDYFGEAIEIPKKRTKEFYQWLGEPGKDSFTLGSRKIYKKNLISPSLAGHVFKKILEYSNTNPEAAEYLGKAYGERLVIIHDGLIPFKKFFEDYREFTPERKKILEEYKTRVGLKKVLGEHKKEIEKEVKKHHLFKRIFDRKLKEKIALRKYKSEVDNWVKSQEHLEELFEELQFDGYEHVVDAFLFDGLKKGKTNLFGKELVSDSSGQVFLKNYKRFEKYLEEVVREEASKIKTEEDLVKGLNPGPERFLGNLGSYGKRLGLSESDVNTVILSSLESEDPRIKAMRKEIGKVYSFREDEKGVSTLVKIGAGIGVVSMGIAGFLLPAAFYFPQQHQQERIKPLMDAGINEDKAIQFDERYSPSKTFVWPWDDVTPYQGDEIIYAKMWDKAPEIAENLHGGCKRNDPEWGDRTTEAVWGDKDNDLLLNFEEMFEHGTDLNNPDTSGDGLKDGIAIKLGFNPFQKYPGLSDKIENLQLEKISPDLDDDRMNNEFEWLNRTEIGGLYDPFIKNDRYVIVLDSGFNENISPSPAALQWQNLIDYFFIEKQKILPQNLIKLYYKDATYSNLENSIFKVADMADNNDFVFVILEGHGSRKVLALRKGPDYHRWSDFIYYENLDTYLDKIRAKVVVVGNDACFSNYSQGLMSKGSCPRILLTSSDYIGGYYWLNGTLLTNVLQDPEMGVDTVLSKRVFQRLKDEDLNDYISIGESFKAFKEYIEAGNPHQGPPPEKKSFYQYPEINDFDLASKVYFGDYKFI
jgi:hypothetical protein